MWYHAVLIRCLCRSVGETLISMPRHPIRGSSRGEACQQGQGYCCLHIGLSPPSRQPTKFQQSSLRLEVLECRKRRTSCFPHMALAPRSVGAASGTDAGRCLAGSLGAARLPTRRRAAMAPPQRLPLLGSRPGAAEIGAPSHRLQHPRGTAVLPTPPRPANTIGRAVVIAPGQKCRRRRAVPLSDVRRPAAAGGQ